MKRLNDEKILQRSVDLVDDVKTAFAKMYIAWSSRGSKREDFVDFLKESGYDVPARSLSRWVTEVIQHGSVVSKNFAAGRPRTLSLEEIETVVGYVLHLLSIRKEVHLATIQKFILEFFDTNVSLSMVRNLLDEEGFSSRVTQSRSSTVQLDSTSLSRMAFDWLRNNSFRCPTSLLCSVDFTFTSHRNDRRVSYALKGGEKPKSDSSISRFTNCIVTCIWADGLNRTPSELYTYNQEFRFDRCSTARRKAQLDQLEACLRTSNINPNRIVYVGELKKERRSYVSESADILRQFFGLYQVPSNCIVLSDNGNSFMENGESVLEKIGFKTHLQYPAAVHQFLSPNDNKLHGAAKQKWRNMGLDFSDDVASSIALLSCLDASSKDVSMWFDANLQLSSRVPKMEKVQKTIGNQKIEECEYCQTCLLRNRTAEGIEINNDVGDTSAGLNCCLDGVFWTN